jgi:hypothetical protein
MGIEKLCSNLHKPNPYDTADYLGSEDAMVTMRRNGTPQTISAKVAKHSRANAALRSGLQPCSKSGSS